MRPNTPARRRSSPSDKAEKIKINIIGAAVRLNRRFCILQLRLRKILSPCIILASVGKNRIANQYIYCKRRYKYEQQRLRREAGEILYR